VCALGAGSGSDGGSSRAVRRAWLTLEIALAGPPLRERIAALLPGGEGVVLRQQIDVLLDLFGRAGLEGDDPEVRRAYAEELRAARRLGAQPGEESSEVEGEGEPDAPLLNGHAREAKEAQGRSLAGIARDLGRAGYPTLAHLVQLRSVWDEPLLLGVIEDFLRRSLADQAAGRRGDSWRCLEKTAFLLERSEEEVEALLDRSEEFEDARADEEGPDPVAALYELGLSRCRRGDYRKAAAHFTAALKLDPANAVLYHQRGEAYRLLCEYERAIADLNAALRLSPLTPSILVSRAAAHHYSGEQERAVADCTAALALDPGRPEAYRTRAAAAAELGEPDQALADLTRLLALAPEDDEAVFLRGLVRAQQRDFTAAVVDFTRALELNPHHVLAWLNRGHAHRRRGEYAQAIRDYGEVLRRHPSNARAHSGRGLAHKLQGQLSRAIADFTEAINLKSGAPLDHYHRGVLYRAKGDLALALADLDEAIRVQPDFCAALYCRGKIHLTQGQYRLAVLDLTEAVRLNPGLLAGWLSRALASDRLGDHQEGVADAVRAVELDATSSAAWLVRGVIYAHLGERQAAIADLTEALRLDDRCTLAYQERGMARMLQGDYDGALVDCNRVVALEPGNAQAYASRSVVYHFKGQVELALTDYSRALQIDPRRVMTGWNEPLAEGARGQLAQRLADYIDGLRSEAPVAEPSLSEFRIIVARPEAQAPPRPSVKKPVRKKQRPAPARSPRETVVTEARSEATKPEMPAAGAVALEPVSLQPVPQAARAEPAAPPFPAPAIADDEPAPAAEGQDAFEIAFREEENLPVFPESTGEEESLARPAAPAVTDASSEEKPALTTPTGASKPRPWGQDAREAESPAPAGPAKVLCRNCYRETTPLPVGDGRGRCRFCNSVYPLAAAGAKPLVKKREKKEPFLDTWKTPLKVVAGAAVLVVLLVVFRSHLRGSGRVRVYPAQGKAEYEGKPLANATVFLHPVGVKNPVYPRPRAVVQEDGSFALGTYRKDDGAPAGEYKVTVQWFGTRPGSSTPVNLLPPKYGGADTSGLTVRIEEGKNLLPPIQLTRTGRR
jgi:tetratricopeptide (TPR) repeat protein